MTPSSPPTPILSNEHLCRCIDDPLHPQLSSSRGLSRKEFSYWFSQPLTHMVEGSRERNDDLIRRLHSVVRPFLLRRLKKVIQPKTMLLLLYHVLVYFFYRNFPFSRFFRFFRFSIFSGFYIFYLTIYTFFLPTLGC